MPLDYPPQQNPASGRRHVVWSIVGILIILVVVLVALSMLQGDHLFARVFGSAPYAELEVQLPVIEQELAEGAETVDSYTQAELACGDVVSPEQATCINEQLCQSEAEGCYAQCITESGEDGACLLGCEALFTECQQTAIRTPNQ